MADLHLHPMGIILLPNRTLALWLRQPELPLTLVEVLTILSARYFLILRRPIYLETMPLSVVTLLSKVLAVLTVVRSSGFISIPRTRIEIAVVGPGMKLALTRVLMMK
jgi:hypothetical protein